MLGRNLLTDLPASIVYISTLGYTRFFSGITFRDTHNLEQHRFSVVHPRYLSHLISLQGFTHASLFFVVHGISSTSY